MEVLLAGEVIEDDLLGNVLDNDTCVDVNEELYVFRAGDGAGGRGGVTVAELAGDEEGLRAL